MSLFSQQDLTSGQNTCVLHIHNLFFPPTCFFVHKVRHTFLHFNTREQSADFFPETGVEEFLPPRLVGRRARTPDPIRALPEEEEPPSAGVDAKE